MCIMHINHLPITHKKYQEIVSYSCDRIIKNIVLFNKVFTKSSLI